MHVAQQIKTECGQREVERTDLYLLKKPGQEERKEPILVEKRVYTGITVSPFQ